MGEVKSALELALERSKKFVISDEEKEKIKQKEILQKATSLFHRYKEGHLSLNEVLKEIERMDEKTRGMVKEALLSQWMDALSLDDDSERLLDAIESVKNRSLGDLKQKFHHFLSEYHGEIEKTRQKMSLQLLEALKREGISGDAVEPNLEAYGEWKELLELTHRSFRGKIDDLKETLRKL